MSVAHSSHRPRGAKGERLLCKAWSRHLALAGVLASLGLASSEALAEAPARAPEAATPEDPDDLVRAGPLAVSASGRRRVRGGRSETASILVAWTAPARDPDREARAALAAFERATLPDRPRRTIVTEPPEAWMQQLVLPDLPIRWNRGTVEYLGYFRDDPRGRAMLRAWFRRAGRYEARLRTILRKVGVPEDLALVVLAESAFHPRARSEAGAAGLWQFMDPTASVYGLVHDHWIDERHDVEKSTYAAALYLLDLHVRFGSWELALAAFNAGYGLVMTTIERHNTNNFWALCEIESGLPYATTNYVPKIMAVALVSRNRETFGVTASEIDALPPADWAEVRVQQSTALTTLADALDVDVELLAEYNAQLVRGRTPPRREGYSVRIPRDKLEAFEAAAPRLQAAWARESVYEVRHGETLEAIATRVGVDERVLRRMNGIEDAAEIAGGVVLVVPHTNETRATAAKREASERVLAAVPPLAPGPQERLLFVLTTRATTPQALASAFATPWERVVEWNDLDPSARLQANQVLQVLVPNDFDRARAGVLAYEPHEVEHVIRGSRTHLEAALRRRGLSRRGYRVRAGDTLERIGRRFALTTGDLARINAMPRDEALTAGSMLVVYVPPERIRGTTRAPEPIGFVARGADRSPSLADTARVPGRGQDTRPEASPAPADPEPRRPSTAETARRPGTR